MDNRVLLALLTVFYLFPTQEGEGEHLEILWTYMKVSLIMWTEAWSETSLTNKLFSYITFGYSAKCPEMPTKPLDLSHIAASQWALNGEMWPSCVILALGHRMDIVKLPAPPHPAPPPPSSTGIGSQKLSWKIQPPAVSWQRATATVFLPPSSKIIWDP